MKDNTILRKSLAFSVRIVNLHKYLSSQKKEYILSRQICKHYPQSNQSICNL